MTKKKVTVGPSESMSKSKKNTIDPEEMINMYGADSIRWFMLSDSPPDRDIQWSNAGVAAAHKFIQRVWLLTNKIVERKNIKSSAEDEKNFLVKINKYLFKITNLIEKFQLNVAIANIYETIRFLEENLEKNVSNQCFFKSQANIMKAMMPFTPHLSCECLSKLEGKDFYPKIEWPKIEKSLLIDEKVTIVIQVNGKKRGLISAKKDLAEEEAIKEAKKVENIEKNLKDKKIVKNIFVKNKIINFITT